MLPGYTPTNEQLDGIPGRWSSVLDLDQHDRGRAIADSLALGNDSHARGYLRRATNVRLLIPTRKKDAKRQSLWRLGVECKPEAVIFAPPVERDAMVGLPEDYSLCLHSLGPFQFGALAGYVFCPAAARGMADRLRSYPHTPDTLHSFIPFFDHQTGDYDGWNISEEFTITRFEHEKNGLEPLGVGGFLEWFDLMISSLLDL
jgi:hypothetical protein